ncbi:unnamed protein product (macronuclear) [Paramecium tetraurelia]|uniref:Uncharacterized protein n=1 Tax=Paramecium tetraurelia TaxID=5888 RepID=A0CMD6_PARTE|nr:uncharacterized protein GSPATT00008432001 [Paramecium tetraurelia]CAK71953.1 unnamed protein product [Paramecium tetraurelia]|eukprot:XP_001439350.1 hypothetical protein (macronuclear) [Paramecium tetraurelia strain d4-2]
MKKIKKQKNYRSKYNSINSNERALIIQYIEQYKYSTSHVQLNNFQVSLITGHNISTIKAIYSVYKKEGRVQKKEKRDKILNITTQVLLLVVDDTNGKCVKLGEEIQKFEAIKEEDKNIRDSKEKMIQELLQNKKCQILSLLTNQQAVNNFTQDVNNIGQEKALSNEFLTTENNLNIKCGHKQSLKYLRNRQQENFPSINQNLQMLDKGFYSELQSRLYEQHKLMRM